MATDPRSDAAPATLPTAFVCRWASALLLDAPDADALAAYRSPEGEKVLTALRSNPALGRIGEVLSELIASEDGLSAAADRLATEHSRAFLVGGPRAAPPYASVWLSPKALLWQEPARQMVGLLAETGLIVDASTPEPPDHIGIQLNLLAVLLEREAKSAEVPIPAADFAREHLLNWMPAFADALARGHAPFFYPALIEGMIGFLRRNVTGQQRSERSEAGAEPAAS